MARSAPTPLGSVLYMTGWKTVQGFGVGHGKLVTHVVLWIVGQHSLQYSC